MIIHFPVFSVSPQLTFWLIWNSTEFIPVSQSQSLHVVTSPLSFSPSLSFSLFLCLSSQRAISLSVCLSVSVRLSVCLSVFRTQALSQVRRQTPSVRHCQSPSQCLSVRLCLIVSDRLSLCLTLSICHASLPPVTVPLSESPSLSQSASISQSLALSR
jgi:hypothetical protein